MIAANKFLEGFRCSPVKIFFLPFVGDSSLVATLSDWIIRYPKPSAMNLTFLGKISQFQRYEDLGLAPELSIHGSLVLANQ